VFRYFFLSFRSVSSGETRYTYHIREENITHELSSANSFPEIEFGSRVITVAEARMAEKTPVAMAATTLQRQGCYINEASLYRSSARLPNVFVVIR